MNMVTTQGSDLEQRIRDAFRVCSEIEFAILFGSLAAGRASEGSDLDLAWMRDGG